MKKIISKILKSFIRITLKFNFHFVYAFLISKVTGIIHSKNNDGILVFGRISSDMSLMTKNKKFNYFYLHRLQFFIPSLFLDKKLMSQRSYFKFKDQTSYNQKLKLRNNLLKILKFLKKHGNLKFILVSSYNYFEHQEWANAGKELGIELIVYYKESVVADGRIGGYNYYISKSSNDINNIDKVLVYGESGFRQFKDTNIIDNEKIFKVGSLKTDSLYSNLKNLNTNKFKKTITLYAFPCGEFQDDFDATTHYSQVWQAGYWCPNLWKDTINLFAKLSNKYLDINFLVKTKSPTSTNAVKTYITDSSYDNLLFSNEMTTEEVYENSLLVVGFNTTVLIEMLSTDIPCLIPQWSESNDIILKNKLLLTKKSEAYNSANNPKEFTSFIENLLNNPDLICINRDKQQRDEIVNYYLHAVDGKVSNRIEKILNE